MAVNIDSAATYSGIVPPLKYLDLPVMNIHSSSWGL